MASFPEWLEALSTFAGAAVALVAAWVGLKTFRNQRAASDVQLALGIFAEINRYWDRLSENSGSYQYNMGQILAQFEIAAGLFNNKILEEKAAIILADHIVEIFCQIKDSPDGAALLEQCKSSEATFSELKKFINKRAPQALNALKFIDERQTAGVR